MESKTAARPLHLNGRDSAHLRTLYEVNDLLKKVEADGLDIEVILPAVLRTAASELSAHSGSIFVVDQNQRITHAWLIDNSQVRQAQSSAPFLAEIMSDGLAGQAIQSQQPIVIDDTRSDSRWLPRPGHITEQESWSAMCVPFIIRGRAIGAITVTRPGRAEFTPADQNLLAAIANQAGSTIENAQLYEEAQRQLRIQALLNEAGKIINSSLKLDEILQSLLSQANELLHVEALSIALLDPKTDELVFTVSEGIGSEEIIGMRMPPNQGVAGWVMVHAEPALVQDTSQDPRFSSDGDERTRYPTRAMLCAPIHARGEVIGTIQGINPEEGSFAEEDLYLLVNLANLASSAIANAQQFEKTQSAEARYLGLFEDSIDPIILTDHQGQIVEMNHRAGAFFGYDRAELIERPLRALHLDTNEEDARPPLQSVNESDQVRVVSSHIVTNAERIIPVEVHAKRILSGENELLQWIYHDISKQIELEEMRRDLTGMLFHDLQSPLGNVISSLQLLEYELSPDSGEGVWSMLEIATRSSKQLQNLVRSLLDIHRLEAGKAIINQDHADLTTLVEEAHDIVRPSLQKRNIRLEREIPDNLPPVYIDDDMIRRVLVNLLDNAIKFNPSDQTIRIKVQPMNSNDEDTSARLRVSVSDQGSGIPPQYRQVIFDKFRRVQNKSKAKGLGLGLAFCQMAVEAHGGRIWVDDAPGGGARFNFTIPTA